MTEVATSSQGVVSVKKQVLNDVGGPTLPLCNGGCIYENIIYENILNIYTKIYAAFSNLGVRGSQKLGINTLLFPVYKKLGTGPPSPRGGCANDPTSLR